MRKVKVRKPRGVKKSGYPSYNMCPHCYMPGCDPFGGSLLYRDKIERRLKKGVCPACGHFLCRCKSKLTHKAPLWK